MITGAERMTSQDEVAKKVDALWHKHLPTIRSRMEVIALGLEALQRGDITEQLQITAAQEAHKLAGSLGAFGLNNGSDAAAEIEKLFSAEEALTDTTMDRLRERFQQLTREIRAR